jgi:hypothetical protein
MRRACSVVRPSDPSIIPAVPGSYGPSTAAGSSDDHANGIIANRIIELVKAGERNPDQLCESALNKLRGHLFGD